MTVPIIAIIEMEEIKVAMGKDKIETGNNAKTGTPKNWPERWVLYVGRKALGRYWPILLFFYSVVFGFVSLLFQWVNRAALGTICAVVSVMCLFLALLYFERRQFYIMIKRQEEQIQELKMRLGED